MKFSDNDLRRGNIVMSKSGVLLVVLEIMSSGITYDRLDMAAVCDHCEWEHLCPVPVSPEALAACGFVVVDHAVFWSNGNKGAVFYEMNGSFPIRFKDGVYAKYFECEDDLYSWTGEELKYLHQLQNLYKELVRKDLIVKNY